MQKQKRSTPHAQHAQRGAAVHLAMQAGASMIGGFAAAALLFSGLAALRCKVDIAPQLLSPIATVAMQFCGSLRLPGGKPSFPLYRPSKGRRCFAPVRLAACLGSYCKTVAVEFGKKAGFAFVPRLCFPCQSLVSVSKLCSRVKLPVKGHRRCKCFVNL